MIDLSNMGPKKCYENFIFEIFFKFVDFYIFDRKIK
jgi:hypothetical protein